MTGDLERIAARLAAVPLPAQSVLLLRRGVHLTPAPQCRGGENGCAKAFLFFIIPHSELRIPHYFALIVIMQKQKRVRLKADA